MRSRNTPTTCSWWKEEYADSLFLANGKVQDKSMQVGLIRCDNGKCFGDAMKDVDVSNFNPSKQVPLSSRVSDGKETGWSISKRKRKGAWILEEKVSL